MMQLTTRQRDILKVLLSSGDPIRTSDLASEINLTTRQVNYSMRGLRSWLKKNDAFLQTTPGVGVKVDCQAQQKEALIEKLTLNENLQLVLSPEQRQQLICFLLLINPEPVILTQICLNLRISRSTVISDLDQVESWLEMWGIDLERKQNYGIWITNPEKDKQQVLLSLIWGDSPFKPSIFQVSFQIGLVFLLEKDIDSTPVIKEINNFLNLSNMKKIFNKVVFVEDFLGGRFADEAVLYLALVFSVLIDRIKMGIHIQIPEQEITLLKKMQEWKAAERLAKNLVRNSPVIWEDSDIAYIVMHILSSPVLENWNSDYEKADAHKDLFLELLEKISLIYTIEGLKDDPTLREGIVNYLVPLFNQHKYKLWFPKANVELSTDIQFDEEIDIGGHLNDIIYQHMHITLQEEDMRILLALVRAASIRMRSYKFNNVILVCPSGMATAQLLTARLKTRFPHLGKVSVLSFRELDDEKVSSADLIITLMPLPEAITKEKPVIQVSPQLFPCDIEAITSFLG